MRSTRGDGSPPYTGRPNSRVTHAAAILLSLSLAGCGCSETAGTAGTAALSVSAPPAGTLAAGPPKTSSRPRTMAYTLYHFQRVLKLSKADTARRLRLSRSQSAAIAPLAERAEAMLKQLVRDRPGEDDDTLERVFLPWARHFEAVVDKTLSQNQSDRLHRLLLAEQRGAMVLLMPGVPEHLRLSEAQLQGIEAIVEQGRQSVDWKNVGLLDVPRLLRQAKQSRARALQLLSKEQRRAFDELVKP